jgi:hypothetical protein
VTCNTPNSAIDGMNCKLVEEITRNQVVLDLSETPIEVFLHQSCYILKSGLNQKYNLYINNFSI